MRLSIDQIHGIINALNKFIKKQSAELRLFGSRTNDSLKGGDIDLLLITRTSTLEQLLLSEKFKMLSSIKANIGDQKIDLTIIIEKEIENDDFIKTIYSDSVLIHKW